MISLMLAISLVMGTWEIGTIPDKVTERQRCYVMHVRDDRVRLQDNGLVMKLAPEYRNRGVRFRFDDEGIFYAAKDQLLTGNRIIYEPTFREGGKTISSVFHFEPFANAKRLRYSAGKPPIEIFGDIELAETDKALVYLRNKEECENNGR